MIGIVEPHGERASKANQKILAIEGNQHCVRRCIGGWCVLGWTKICRTAFAICSTRIDLLAHAAQQLSRLLFRK